MSYNSVLNVNISFPCARCHGIERFSYDITNLSSVYCTFLYATKPSDRVQNCKLFNLLEKHDMPLYILRMLTGFDMNNQTRSVWADVRNDYFVASNGVKQGGVLSPPLICICINNLLVKLSDRSVSCYTVRHNVGALTYANDFALVVATPTAMSKLPSVYGTVAIKYDIQFNAAKSKCMFIKVRNESSSWCMIRNTNLVFEIINIIIEYVDSNRLLRYVTSLKFNDTEDILNEQRVFIGQDNKVFGYFDTLDAVVKPKLSAYCTSFYGSELWPMDHG
jgi:hypothetical protein